ncbi:MAG: glycosyltransferase family 2 protein [Deltaproteobacteria bacterium]|nr:glycosyltransferase family 2 protein [Deltaproteobacteria bacterium]
MIPANEEAAALPALWARLSPILDRLEEEGPARIEVVLVDDGSEDDTWAVMQALRGRDPRLVLVRLLRRFGQQAALLAGLERARGDAVVILDADLQDPPEIVPEMVERWREGFSVVHGVRRTRRPDTWFKRRSAALFRRLVTLLAGTGLEQDVGDFVLLDREVVRLLLRVGGPRAFLRGEVAWAGFQHCAVPYDREPRVAGATKYSLRKMTALALDGLTSLTFLPLRLVALLGLGVLGVALGIGLLAGEATTAWLTALAGLQLLGLGLLGEYVGRLHERSLGRPTYLIERVEPPETYGELGQAAEEGLAGVRRGTKR